MRKTNCIGGSQVKRPIPLCVNWHITKKCNYNCVYCFAKFNGVTGNLPFNKAIEVPGRLKDAGCRKLNIAGGEPSLYSHLSPILKESRRNGLITTIQTNGSLLSAEWIEQNAPYIDGIGISLDSASEEVQFLLGRGRGDHVEKTIEKVQLLKEHDIPVKINTVVTRCNMNDDLRPLIKEIDPYRWKVFQVLLKNGENDEAFPDLKITPEEFSRYCTHNKRILSNGTQPVFETNEIMRGSYRMIAPDGRFYDSVSGRIRYWETDFSNIDRCLSRVPFEIGKFIERRGNYEIKSLSASTHLS